MTAKYCSFGNFWWLILWGSIAQTKPPSLLIYPKPGYVNILVLPRIPIRGYFVYINR